MCGIAGIVPNSELPVEHLSRRMQNSLQHRGPDDQGIYISSNRKAALAHTRLSIVDLAPAGHQPMSTSNDRYWITFNGEIYNFQELRSQLQSQCEKFYPQIQDWLEGEWSNYLPEVDCPKNISLQAWYRRWSLAILQNWWEKISK